MIDLHVHTSFGSGVHPPAIMMSFAKAVGYKALVFSDHVDHSSMQQAIESLLPIGKTYSLYSGIDAYVGIVLTHVPPPLIPDAVAEAREMGAQFVSVYGQCINDMVAEGTNLAAIEGEADMLCHPGLITEQEAVLAAEKGTLLEVTTNPEYALANGLLVTTARSAGAKLVITTGARHKYDFVSQDMRKAVGLGAGMSPQEIRQADTNSRDVISRLLMRKE